MLRIGRIDTDFKAKKMLLEAAREYATFNRRSLLAGAGALAGASVLGKNFIQSVSAEEVKKPKDGKTYKIGIPLN